LRWRVYLAGQWWSTARATRLFVAGGRRMTTSAPDETSPDGGKQLGRESVRALHVYSGNLYGGIETFLRSLATHGDRASPAPEFALCFEGRLARELREAGATVHLLGEVRARSPQSIIAARRVFAETLREGRYAVVVCHSAWPHALFAPVVRAHGARLAYHMHDVPNPRGWPDRWASLTAPDRVLCNSEFTASSGRWFFPKTSRIVARCPVDFGRSGGRRDRAQVRASFGATAEAIVILQASRMQAWKGHRLLIDALGGLRANPRWVCWIAGAAQRSGEIAYERELRMRVARLGLEDRIKFLGLRSDVPALMDAADVFCQPNVGAEPFGIALVEALAAGLPVVTTAMGGALEIVTPSCGRLVPPDARSVAASLAEMIDDDERRAALSSAGPARARELCDPAERSAAISAELARLAKVGGSAKAPARLPCSGTRSGRNSSRARLARLWPW
jgi:glycosyltransferase involved in cell wall biosynthesis